MISRETLEKYLGSGVASFLAILMLGIYLATAYPNYAVSPNTLQQEKTNILAKVESGDNMLNHKLDINVTSLKLTDINSQIFFLKREKSAVLDVIDNGRAKQRHYEDLKEINKQLEELETEKKELNKEFTQ